MTWKKLEVLWCRLSFLVLETQEALSVSRLRSSALDHFFVLIIRYYTTPQSSLSFLFGILLTKQTSYTLWDDPLFLLHFFSYLSFCIICSTCLHFVFHSFQLLISTIILFSLLVTILMPGILF